MKLAAIRENSFQELIKVFPMTDQEFHGYAVPRTPQVLPS
jgi:hypothetical protein